MLIYAHKRAASYTQELGHVRLGNMNVSELYT